MRKIELKVVKADEGQQFAYADILKSLLRDQPQGMNLEQVETAVRLIGAVRAAASANPSVLLLEESDWQYLKQRLDIQRWFMADSAIVQLVHDVRNAPTVEVKVNETG